MGVFIGRIENKLVDRMSALADESRVLANNIANANVPSYTAKRINFKEILGQENMKLNLTRTNPRHLSSKLKSNDQKIPIMDTGKPVELDEEILKMTQNSLEYQTMVKLLSERFRLYSSIISERVE